MPLWGALLSAALAMLVAISACYWLLLAPSQLSRSFDVARPGPLGGMGWDRVLGPTTAVASVPDAPAPQPLAVAPAGPQMPPFRLWGLVSDAHGGGYALLGVGDEMPAAYAATEQVRDGWAVMAVHERSVQLRPPGGGAALSLELPDPDGAVASTVGVSP